MRRVSAKLWSEPNPGCRWGWATFAPKLTEEIVGYLAERNLHPVRYVWRAEGAEILAKIQRAREKQAIILKRT